MTYEFRPAKRQRSSLLIGLFGPSGGGKTLSALLLARGLAGAGGRIAMIDTEAGRGLHYADRCAYDYSEIGPPFRPDTYTTAIAAADKAGYDVVIVDSVTHEWAGEGGILDWHEDELQRMAGDDWKKREACKMAAWIKPKQGHKKMVNRLLQVRAHLILCFRAEEKVEMVRENGKTAIVPKGWQPICEKNMPYEMTVSLLLPPNAEGVPTPIKLQDQHRHAFPAGQPICEQSGVHLAAWAHGAAGPADAAFAEAMKEARKGRAAFAKWWASDEGKAKRHYVNDRVDELKAACADAGQPAASFTLIRLEGEVQECDSPSEFHIAYVAELQNAGKIGADAVSAVIGANTASVEQLRAAGWDQIGNMDEFVNGLTRQPVAKTKGD